MSDKAKKVIDDLKDATREAKHRNEAEFEKEEREDAGDSMTAGEKLRSVVQEDSEKTKADVDKAKRELRDKT